MTESTRTTRPLKAVVRNAVGVGREVQGRIYREGVFGRLPVVPTEPDALEALAQRRMSPQAWSYVAGGAGQQRTVRANLEAFDRHRIVPRMLVDVEHRDQSVELFGRRIPSPLLFAPIGVLEMAHRDAEHAVAARDAELQEAAGREAAEQRADELAESRLREAEALAADATSTEQQAAAEKLRLEREAAAADQQAAQLRAQTEK